MLHHMCNKSVQFYSLKVLNYRIAQRMPGARLRWRDRVERTLFVQTDCDHVRQTVLRSFRAPVDGTKVQIGCMAARAIRHCLSGLLLRAVRACLFRTLPDRPTADLRPSNTRNAGRCRIDAAAHAGLGRLPEAS